MSCQNVIFGVFATMRPGDGMHIWCNGEGIILHFFVRFLQFSALPSLYLSASAFEWTWFHCSNLLFCMLSTCDMIVSIVWAHCACICTTEILLATSALKHWQRRWMMEEGAPAPKGYLRTINPDHELFILRTWCIFTANDVEQESRVQCSSWQLDNLLVSLLVTWTLSWTGESVCHWWLLNAFLLFSAPSS